MINKVTDTWTPTTTATPTTTSTTTSTCTTAIIAIAAINARETICQMTIRGSYPVVISSWAVY